MNPISTIISPAGQILAVEGTKLPFVVWGGFKVIHTVHSVWGGIRWYRLVKNPDNWTTILASWGINQVIESNIFTRIGIRLVYLCKIIHDLSRQHLTVHDRYRSLLASVKGTYGPYTKIVEQERLSLKTRFKQTMNYSTFRIRQIAYCFFDFIKELYALSMHYMDAYQLLTFDSQIGTRALAELIIERERYINELENNRTLLIEQLEENKATIDVVLKKMGSKGDGDSFIAKIRTITGVVTGVGLGLKLTGAIISEVARPLTHNTNQRFLDFPKMIVDIIFNENSGIMRRVLKALGKKLPQEGYVEFFPKLKLSNEVFKKAEEKSALDDQPSPWKRNVKPTGKFKFPTLLKELKV